MNPETWKLVATLGGLFVTMVTGPIIWAIRAESKLIRKELELAITKLGGELRTEMKDMEQRLNERIDTRLVHR